MDFPAFRIARPEFKDFKRPTLSQHTHVEVILMDASNPGIPPIVFQLNNDYIGTIEEADRLRQELSNIHGQAFTFLGEAKEIDEPRKTIMLSDENIVSYKYLIVASSPCREGEYHHFLTALKDTLLLHALNARARILEQQPTPKQGQLTGKASVQQEATPIKMKIHESDAKGNAPAVHPKKVCQVKT